MAISLGGFSGGGGAVTSVNTQTGVVVLSADDLLADHVASNYTPVDNNIDGHLAGIDTQLGTLVSGLTYKGSFNATTGAPSLANALQGDLYVISVAGTIYGETWAVNDHLLINADMGGSIDNAKIDKIDNTEPTNVLISTNNLSDLDNASTARTNLGLGTAATSASTSFLQVVNNLGDITSATTARGHLGLGTAATLDTGTSNGDVVVLDATGLPAVDGSQLTGITATDSSKLAIANNLSDLNNVATARTNLGLGTAATSASTSFLQVVNNLGDITSATTARGHLGLGTAATLDTGTSNGDVVVLDATGLPAVDGSQLTGITATDSSKLAIANNLSDLNNVATARSNLGLGTAATSASTSFLQVVNNLGDITSATTARGHLGLGTAATLDTGTSSGNVVVLDATGLPAVDGSQLTGITATDSSKLAIANNLSDLNNVATARTNLGLGTAATSASTSFLQVVNNLGDITSATTARGHLGLGTAATLNTGTSSGNVVVLDATGLPAVDGSQLTGITATDSSKLAIANNLSDLNNVATARSNLGLGTAATLDTGTANGNIVVLDATGLPAVDGSQLTGITATDSTKLAIANNLSDLNNVATARSNLGLGTAAIAASTDFLSATGPDALGGNINVNGHDIVSVSNGDIEVDPDGTGSFKIKGNATSGSGRIVLNCEQNTHGITLKGPPHSAAASYTLTFPNTDGTANQVLKTDGSGGLDWVDQASGGGGWTYSAITADPANAQASYHYSCTGTFTITLATSGINAGEEIRVKNMGTGTITIDPQTQTIDGSTTDYTMDVQYSAITLVSTGTNWEII